MSDIEQLTLDSPTARSTDPYTSKEAQPSSKKRVKRVFVLIDWVKRMPSGFHTKMEIAQWAIDHGVDWHYAFTTSNQRASDAVTLGLLVEGERRRCGKTGHMAIPVGLPEYETEALNVAP